MTFHMNTVLEEPELRLEPDECFNLVHAEGRDETIASWRGFETRLQEYEEANFVSIPDEEIMPLSHHLDFELLNSHGYRKLYSAQWVERSRREDFATSPEAFVLEAKWRHADEVFVRSAQRSQSLRQHALALPVDD